MQLVAKGFPLAGCALGLGPLLHQGLQFRQELPLFTIKVAAGEAISGLRSLRRGGAAGTFSPQDRGGRFPLLEIDGFSLVPDQQLPVGPLQDLHLESGVAGSLRSWQQLQDPPVVLHRVVPGHLAGVLEAQGFGKTQVGGHRMVSGFRMLRLHGETCVETRKSCSTAVVWSMVRASARRSSVTSRS